MKTDKKNTKSYTKSCTKSCTKSYKSKKKNQNSRINKKDKNYKNYKNYKKRSADQEDGRVKGSDEGVKSGFVKTAFNDYSDKKFALIAASLIFILTFSVYFNNIHNKFTNWDDPALILHNKSIRSLKFDNIVKIFTPGGGTFQPVRVLSYAIDYSIDKFNPVVFHLHNNILHALAAVLLFLSLFHALPKIQGFKNIAHSLSNIPMKMIPADEPLLLFSVDKWAFFMAFSVAVLFAVHPVNVEAVTWLSGRKYVEMSFWGFLSFYLFIINSNRIKMSWMLTITSSIACCLSILSSPFAIAFPALFFLYQYCREESLNPLAALKNGFYLFMPYLIMGVFFGVLLLRLLITTGSHGGASVGSYGGSYWNTIWTILRVLFDYVRNLLFPFWLNARYPDWVSMSPFEFKIGVVLLFAVLFVVYLIKQIKSDNKYNKFFFFCVAWFILAWLPGSNIIPISTKMADRYIYIASPGLFLLFVCCFSCLINWLWSSRRKYLRQEDLRQEYLRQEYSKQDNSRQNNSRRDNSRRGNSRRGNLKQDNLRQNNSRQNNSRPVTYYDAGFLIIFAGLCIFFSVFTIHRNFVWRDSITLWTDSFKKDPVNFLALNNLGTAYFYKGEYKKALKILKKSERLRPNFYAVHCNLGSTYLALHDYKNAVKHFLKNIELDSKGFHNKGRSYFGLGELYAKIKQYDKSLEFYKKGLKIEPDNEEAYYNMGRVAQNMHRPDMALTYFMHALKLNKEYPEVYNSLGNLYLMQHDFKHALENYNKALKYRPDYPAVYFNMANAMVYKEKFNSALKYLNKALQQNPNYAMALKLKTQIENMVNNNDKPEPF